MDFKQKLKIIREESGLNIKKISELSGIKYDVLRMYSQGKRNPSTDQIRKIASVLELAPWRELLVEDSDLTLDQIDFLVLVGRMKALGKEAELRSIMEQMQRLSNDE